MYIIISFEPFLERSKTHLCPCFQTETSISATFAHSQVAEMKPSLPPCFPWVCFSLGCEETDTSHCQTGFSYHKPAPETDSMTDNSPCLSLFTQTHYLRPPRARQLAVGSSRKLCESRASFREAE